MDSPLDIDRWVNDNNPPSDRQYAKGWWDYIEMVRRLAFKFEIEDVDVIGTYLMNTPPPEEELIMPVFRLRKERFELILKYDFGIVPEAWTVSLQGAIGDRRPLYRIFDPSAKIRSEAARGFRPEWLYGSYSESPERFTCELPDEWDLATFVRIMIGRPE